MGKTKAPAPSAPSSEAPGAFAALAGLRARLPVASVQSPVDAAAKREPALRLVIRRERGGHGGKTVTVVEGVPGAQLAEVCADLKRGLGTGARVEAEAIQVQGDIMDRVLSWAARRWPNARLIRGN